ncbi:MAG: hypothetical protein R6V59_06270 [Dehalococcoidia bacterium]
MTVALTIGRNLTSALYLPVFIAASLILFIAPFVRMLSGVAFVATIVFVILKLGGILAWSWLWVLAPIWTMAAYLPLMLISPFIMRHTFPDFGRVSPDDPEVMWTESHLNWTLVLGYGAAFLWALVIGELVSLLFSLSDNLAVFGYAMSSVVFLGLWAALAVLLGIWYLKRKGRSLLHLLWWVPLGAFPLLLPAGFLPNLPVVGLAGLGIMFCLGNKRDTKPSIAYVSEQELSDDANYIVINCGTCFQQYRIARGQGIIVTICPHCGREARVRT